MNPSEARDYIRLMANAGDLPGHEFHGNQWTNGNGVTFNEHDKTHVALNGHSVLKETAKAKLVKHGDAEGWLMKSRMKEDGGKLILTKSQAENFNSSRVTLNNPQVLKETDSAILVNHDGKEGWLPKSQIEKDADGNIKMPRWMGSKMQETHQTVSVPHASETESGKAYKLSVDVARADGEPESATIFLPKSQVEHSINADGEHVFKVPAWLKSAKESEYEGNHTQGGWTTHRLLW